MNFYITTAIYYPNAKPHIGHVYEMLISDIYARWYKLFSEKSYFLTGTDENGQKLQKAAGHEEVKSFVDKNVSFFRDLAQNLRLCHDDFIRTTEPRHHKVVHEFWRQMQAAGDIHFGEYEGLYCYSCESFYSAVEVGEEMLCPHHSTKLDRVAEKGYFFRLSRFHDWILEHLKNNPDCVQPHSAWKEMVSRLEGDKLNDLAISRPNKGWGIPVPDDPDHVVYTWFDALINYRSGLDTEQKVADFWPPTLHVIGKEINWFHSIIWPCMLKSVGLTLPKTVYVHPMVLGEDGKKMSKSLGNVVLPEDCLGKYSPDLLRFYFARAISAQQDGRFSHEDVVHKNNSELANDLGNLVSRSVKLYRARVLKESEKESGTAPNSDQKIVFRFAAKDFDLYSFTESLERAQKAMDECDHPRALNTVWSMVRELNGYLNQTEPWRIKDDFAAFKAVLEKVLFGIFHTTLLLQPFIPESSLKILQIITDKGLDSHRLMIERLGSKDGVIELEINEPGTNLFQKIQ